MGSKNSAPRLRTVARSKAYQSIVLALVLTLAGCVLLMLRQSAGFLVSGLGVSLLLLLQSHLLITTRWIAGTQMTALRSQAKSAALADTAVDKLLQATETNHAGLRNELSALQSGFAKAFSTLESTCALKLRRSNHEAR